MEKIPYQPGLVSFNGRRVVVHVKRRCPRCKLVQEFLCPADIWASRMHLDTRLWPGGWQSYALQFQEHHDGTMP